MGVLSSGGHLCLKEGGRGVAEAPKPFTIHPAFGVGHHIFSFYFVRAFLLEQIKRQQKKMLRQ